LVFIQKLKLGIIENHKNDIVKCSKGPKVRREVKTEKNGKETKWKNGFFNI
jgi:hypothetical protein